MFPNEEFLPRAPDSNEIIFEEQPNNDIEMIEPNNQMIAPVVNEENNIQWNEKQIVFIEITNN